MQETLVGAADAIIPKERRKRKKSWITDKILDLMDDRIRLMTMAEVRYRELDRRIQRSCRVEKEERLNARCKDIEESEKVDSRAMATQIRELSGKKRMARSTVIKDKNGEILILTERKCWRDGGSMLRSCTVIKVVIY